MHLPPPPDARELLPPLLACLPTAFLAPQPPDALLPILSPILRQRVAFLAPSTRTENGWLPLLQWDAGLAAKLPAVVEKIQLEPHPVSGELELEDVRPAKYRRLDDETLHARLEVEEFKLVPIFLWCEEDEQSGTGPGWKLAELRTLEDLDDGAEWFDGISEANDASSTHSFAVPQPSTNGRQAQVIATPYEEDEEEEEDDGSYWAAYDRTPGARTPAAKRSPAPRSNDGNARQRTQSELEYFDRYGDVQPALDSHDPDEDMGVEVMGESSLNGQALPQQQQAQPLQQRSLYPPDDPNKPHDSAIATALTQSLSGSSTLPQPRAISPTSSNGSVDRLERQAAAMSNRDDGDERAQLGIKQHISTDIKSLFRLARSVGLSRSDFRETVERELSVLGMMEADD
ncbi:hypothetical protein LTR56_001463 [Elasticomyces elasticus]|nr:hypothetical protein LTR56_001463 [Elasticomyces elasticus]KAK3668614.1 hypothetical protein LTR22_000501 [Elasticomyces elasticus]KAK4931966.1 hypothetical protein LTR49_001653 [Elasticomyces elasticus]KAK5768502.1 hypothetical protein LTS12_001290 [Elasticomyces elasticus]